MNIRFLEHRGGSRQCCLMGVWVVEGGRSWALKGDEREAAGRQEGEGSAKQRNQLGQKCGAGPRKDGVFGGCKKVGVV